MKRLQNTIATGRYSLPVSIFLAITCWLVVYYNTHQSFPEAIVYSYEEYKVVPDWIKRTLSLVCCFIIGFFLIQLNNHYAIIRKRASVQTSLFLLFVAACPLLHVFYPAYISVILVQCSIYNLFSCYQQQKPTRSIFNAFVFLGLASLIFPYFLWFVPIFLIGIGIISQLTFRNFVGGILGIGLPYWLLWAYAYYMGNMEIFYRPFQELMVTPSFDLNIKDWMVFVYFFIIYLVSSVYCFTDKHKDKIRTRAYLRFIILLSLGIFIFIFLYPFLSSSMLLLLLSGISILAAHFLVLTNSKASNWFFIGALIGLMLLFIVNVWMPL